MATDVFMILSAFWYIFHILVRNWKLYHGNNKAMIDRRKGKESLLAFLVHSLCPQAQLQTSSSRFTLRVNRRNLRGRGNTLWLSSDPESLASIF